MLYISISMLSFAVMLVHCFRLCLAFNYYFALNEDVQLVDTTNTVEPLLSGCLLNDFKFKFIISHCLHNTIYNDTEKNTNRN